MLEEGAPPTRAEPLGGGREAGDLRRADGPAPGAGRRSAASRRRRRGPAAFHREQRRKAPPRVRGPDTSRRPAPRPLRWWSAGEPEPEPAQERGLVTDATRSLPPGGFPVVFGHQLVGELPAFVHRPYLVVTMADLWPRSRTGWPGRISPASTSSRRSSSTTSMAIEERLPQRDAIIGLGGGQALDVAKFFAWTRRLPLFQVPTATTVNAPFGHRSGVRDHGRVRYLGWAIPEAVYIDFDVIASAPPNLNRSGVGDVLCYHTARHDWQLADRLGRTEPRWPYDQRPRRRRGDRHGQRDGRPRRDPGGHRGGIRALVDRPSLGRHDVPRLGLESAPHRGRRPLLLLQPRADHGPPFHPRPAGRARASSRAPCSRTTSPSGWPRRSPGPASTSGRRRWASPGTTSARRSGRSPTYVRDVGLWF